MVLLLLLFLLGRGGGDGCVRRDGMMMMEYILRSRLFSLSSVGEARPGGTTRTDDGGWSGGTYLAVLPAQKGMKMGMKNFFLNAI